MENKKFAYYAVNAITFSRIAVAFGIAAAAFNGEYALASKLALGHLAIDKADGVLARRTDTATEIGALRDDIADMYFTSSLGLAILTLANNSPFPDLKPVFALAGILWLLPIIAKDVPDRLKKLNELRANKSFYKPHRKTF